MNRSEKIIVNNMLSAGMIDERERISRVVRNIRRHRMCTAHVGCYCVFDLNSSYYTDSLPRAKRHALANRWRVLQDVLGWWNDSHLKVRDTKTGKILFTAKI